MADQEEEAELEGEGEGEGGELLRVCLRYPYVNLLAHYQRLILFEEASHFVFTWALLAPLLVLQDLVCR